MATLGPFRIPSASPANSVPASSEPGNRRTGVVVGMPRISLSSGWLWTHVHVDFSAASEGPISQEGQESAEGTWGPDKEQSGWGKGAALNGAPGSGQACRAGSPPSQAQRGLGAKAGGTPCEGPRRSLRSEAPTAGGLDRERTGVPAGGGVSVGQVNACDGRAPGTGKDPCSAPGLSWGRRLGRPPGLKEPEQQDWGRGPGPPRV